MIAWVFDLSIILHNTILPLMIIVLEFEGWKKKIEKEDKCQYVTDTWERRLVNFEYVRREYICYRPFLYTSRIKGQTRKWKVKSLGSNRIGAACPSRIIVDYVPRKSSVLVQFYRKHIGHTCDLIRTHIPEHERTKIAGRYIYFFYWMTFQGVWH